MQLFRAKYTPKPKTLRYRFIYLMGPEGVGKSTQARLLESWLRSHRYKTKVVQIRTKHLTVYLLREILTKLGALDRRLSKASEAGCWNPEIPRIWKKIYPLILVLEIINTFILAFLRVFLPLTLNYMVIAENYIIDTCCDLQSEFMRLGINQDLRRRVLKTLLRLMPNSFFIVVLDASYRELTRRYRRHRTSIEPPDYIYLRRKLILHFVRNFHPHHIISTENKMVIKTHLKIREKLLSNGPFNSRLV